MIEVVQLAACLLLLKSAPRESFSLYSKGRFLQAARRRGEGIQTDNWAEVSQDVPSVTH